MGQKPILDKYGMLSRRQLDIWEKRLSEAIEDYNHRPMRKNYAMMRLIDLATSAMPKMFNDVKTYKDQLVAIRTICQVKQEENIK